MKTAVYIATPIFLSSSHCQAEQELKKELEVKLAVSSLVCTVADNASTQRLEQSSSEVARLEANREAGYMEREASLRAELGKISTVVAGLQADIGAAKGWQMGIDNLEQKLMARIEELKAMAEVCTAVGPNALASRKNAEIKKQVHTWSAYTRAFIRAKSRVRHDFLSLTTSLE